jgi:hypothetical protein
MVGFGYQVAMRPVRTRTLPGFPAIGALGARLGSGFQDTGGGRLGSGIAG